jgi:hypothetical protein
MDFIDIQYVRWGVASLSPLLQKFSAEIDLTYSPTHLGEGGYHHAKTRQRKRIIIIIYSFVKCADSREALLIGAKIKQQ